MAAVDDWIDACRRQGITLRRRGQEHCAPARSARPATTASGSSPGAPSPCSRVAGTDTRTGNYTARCSATRSTRGFGRDAAADVPPTSTPSSPTRRSPDQARRARRLFATAHRGQPTYFRRKFPESDRLVCRLDAPRHVARADGTKRFQRDLRLSGLAMSPRWRAAGPLLLTEGVTSALAALTITDPPLGVLACLPETDSSRRPDGSAGAPQPSSRTTTILTRTASGPASTPP